VDFWVQVPYHKTRLSSRGFDVVDELFSELFHTIEIPKLDLLKRLKNTSHLFEQTKELREKSLNHVFELKPVTLEKYTKMHILLVDDIVTSGATMLQLSRLIQSHFLQAKITYVSVAYTVLYEQNSTKA
jgi:predicted amidophosphoribosyltransferase